MATRTRMPPGCYGFQTPGGVEINGKPGGVVELSDDQVAAVRKSTPFKNGIIDVSMGYNLATRGRPCTSPTCFFVAQVWSDTCNRCGSPTEKVQEAK